MEELPSVQNSLEDHIDFISSVFHRLSRIEATMIENRNDIKSMAWMETQLHRIVQALGHWNYWSLLLRQPKQQMTTIHPSCFCQFLYIILRILFETIWIQKKSRMWSISWLPRLSFMYCLIMGVYSPLFLSNVNPYFCKINIIDHEIRCCNRYHIYDILCCYSSLFGQMQSSANNQIPEMGLEGFTYSLLVFVGHPCFL